MHWANCVIFIFMKHESKSRGKDWYNATCFFDILGVIDSTKDNVLFNVLLC